MKVWAALSAVALGVATSPASAQQFQVSNWVEIDNFPRSGSTQRMPQWCWAASLETVFRYYGIDRTQEQIVLATYGTLANLPAFAPQQLYGILNGASFGRDGVDVTVGGFGWGAPPPLLLLDELGQNHPVIAWYRNPGGAGGHAVVVYGANYQTSPIGPIVNAIKFFDPWPGEGERVVNATALASAMTNYFVIRSVSARSGGSRHISRHGAGNDSCEYANDGTCDEPNLCRSGTDTTDCRGGASARPAHAGDTCEYANDGTCDEPNLCRPGTDTTDCRGGASARPARAGDTCEYANDGTCDEPDLCAPGSDITDCAGRRSSSRVPSQPSQVYCCDAYGYRRCAIVFNPGPIGSSCGCPGQGFGTTCP